MRSLRLHLSVMAIAIAVTVGLTPFLGMPTAAAGSVEQPVKILLYGDSITQGSGGDHTWRYFVDQNLRASGVSFDFVGSTQRLHHLPVAGVPASWDAYADPNFDRDSSSRWGQELTSPVYHLTRPAGASGQSEIAKHDPDVVVVLVGLNDLERRKATIDQVIETLRRHVLRAREQNQGIAFLLARYPNLNYSFLPEYNARLGELSRELDTPESRVLVTEDYLLDLGADLIDAAHPLGPGEAKVAFNIARGLEMLGLGRAALATGVPVGLATVTDVVTTPLPAAVEVRWRAVAGAQQYIVEHRNQTRGQPWPAKGISFPAARKRAVIANLDAGDRYEFRVRTKKRRILAERTSVVRQAVPLQALHRVVISQTKATRGGRVRARWAAVPGATAYRIEVVHDRKVRTAVVAGKTTWVGSGFTNGQVVTVRVRPETADLLGPWGQPLQVAVPELRVARGVAAQVNRRGRIVTSVRPIAFAERYQLQVAVTKGCKTVPRPGKFMLTRVSTGPKAALRVKASKRAVWVQWRGERAGVLGPVGPSSRLCLPARP